MGRDGHMIGLFPMHEAVKASKGGTRVTAMEAAMSESTTTVIGTTSQMTDETKQRFIDMLEHIAKDIRSGRIREITIEQDTESTQKLDSGPLWIEYERIPGVLVTVKVRR